MSIKKKYIAEVDFCVYADNDKDAMREAEIIAKRLDLQHDNRCKVIALYERPMGVGGARLVYPKKT